MILFSFKKRSSKALWLLITQVNIQGRYSPACVVDSRVDPRPLEAPWRTGPAVDQHYRSTAAEHHLSCPTVSPKHKQYLCEIRTYLVHGSLVILSERVPNQRVAQRVPKKITMGRTQSHRYWMLQLISFEWWSEFMKWIRIHEMNSKYTVTVYFEFIQNRLSQFDKINWSKCYKALNIRHRRRLLHEIRLQTVSGMVWDSRLSLVI